jgi:hypothetical protein
MVETVQVCSIQGKRVRLRIGRRSRRRADR